MGQTTASNSFNLGYAARDRCSLHRSFIVLDRMLIVPFLVADGTENAINDGIIKDQRIWSIVECSQIMASSIDVLHQRLKVTLTCYGCLLRHNYEWSGKSQETDNGSGYLIWDKDDVPSMDFVTACANLRAHIFGIPQKSRFDVKGKFWKTL